MADLSLVNSDQPYLLLALRDDVSIQEQEPVTKTTHADARTTTLNPPTGVLRTLLQLLSATSLSEDQLVERCAQRVQEAAGAIFFYIDQLITMGLLQRKLCDGQEILATFIPTSPDAKAPHREHAELDTTYQLSTFCFLRADEGKLVLESPLARAKLILHSDRALAFVHHLTAQATVRDAAAHASLSLRSAQLLGTLLIQCRALRRITPTNRLPASDTSKLSSWSFHDLLFHSRSRLGRHDQPAGKTYPQIDRCKPLPALKPAMSPAYIQLSEVDLDALQSTDPAFTTVIERRRSLASRGDSTITLEQLGELLYRSARVRAHHHPDSSRPPYYAYTSRPYPSGGAAYELEIYIAANQCTGLDKGLYHYQAATHRLYHVSDDTPELGQLIENAYACLNKRAVPQTLLVITARHQRLSWAYESIAYSTTLKNVGVLFQTFYLVATAMNLSTCAAGVGDSDLFAKASGLDYYRESSVGEFIVNNGASP